MSIRTHFQVGFALLAALTTAACGQGSYSDAGSESMAKSELRNVALEAPASSPAEAPKPQTVSLLKQRSVIRRAEIAVRVDNVEKSEKSLNKIVETLGGYVDSAQSPDLASANPTIDISLRIPVDKFDVALDRFEALGVRLSKSISSEDVTGQLVDLDARLKTLVAQEETYRGLLRAAKQLNNVITLQDKLTEVRSEIESMAGQRKTLGGLAAFSTVSVHFQQSAAPVAPPTDPNWLAQVWGESTTTFGAAGRLLTSIVVWLAVFSPFWAPVLVILWRLLRPRPTSAAR